MFVPGDKVSIRKECVFYPGHRGRVIEIFSSASELPYEVSFDTGEIYCFNEDELVLDENGLDVILKVSFGD